MLTHYAMLFEFYVYYTMAFYMNIPGQYNTTDGIAKGHTLTTDRQTSYHLFSIITNLLIGIQV